MSRAVFLRRSPTVAMSGAGSPLQRITSSPAWSAYEEALVAQPVLTKGVTSLIGFAIGDVIAQTLIEHAATLDLARVVKFSSFGFLVHGTTCHFFYNYLDQIVPGTDAKPVATKVAIEQIVWNPIFGCLFFAYLTLYDGGSIPQALLRIQQSLATQVTGSWGFWGPAHAINFRYIPTEQRLLYINLLQIFYNVFLSVISTPPPQ